MNTATKSNEKEELNVMGELSLRDYFAAKAMQALSGSAFYMEGHMMTSEVAEHAYEMAGAMLQARKS